MTSDSADEADDPRVVLIGRDGTLAGDIGRALAHTAPGVLHLATSVQVVDRDGRWLLQRRSASKAAFADCWANTCCTHPRLGEEPEDAAIRRLGEELGLQVDYLMPAGVFVYRATDPVSGLVEHEVDHVFVVIASTEAASSDPQEIAQLARLAYPEALELVTSGKGAPWSREVLLRSYDVLSKR